MELFAKLFDSLLVFVYHCFDRIVIHGYLSGLSRPEQVVYFFRDVVGVALRRMQEQVETDERDEVVHDIIHEIEHRKAPAVTGGNGSGNPPTALSADTSEPTGSFQSSSEAD